MRDILFGMRWMSILILVFFELFLGAKTSAFLLHFRGNSPARHFPQFKLEAGDPNRFNSDAHGYSQPIASLCQRMFQCGRQVAHKNVPPELATD